MKFHCTADMTSRYRECFLVRKETSVEAGVELVQVWHEARYFPSTKIAKRKKREIDSIQLTTS